MPDSVPRFVVIGDQYINLAKITYVEMLPVSGLLIFMGTSNQEGEEIASVRLEGKSAERFLQYLDRYAFDLEAN